MPETSPLEATALLLKLRKNGGAGLSVVAQGLARGGEVVMETVGDTSGDLGLAGGRPAQWVKVEASDNPWDQAHAMMRMGFAAGSGDLIAAEPDFQQAWQSAPRTGDCAAAPQDSGGGRPLGPHDAWHLDAGYTGLAEARAAVADDAQRQVTIAHVDTGYDPDHHFRAAHIAANERNFVKNEGAPNSAKDVSPQGGLSNHGHGTGTMGILAGPTIGGAPGATILPIRIADSVVRFTTSTMAQGFAYARQAGAHVLSMSMGGLASDILADAVNDAYAAGMVMVTAAGNNYDGLPVRSIVYPARMRRVVAACGVMANFEPYTGLGLTTMEGCYGPGEKMRTSVCGFSPNIPWPHIGCPDTVDQDGQGTSAATPQVAAALALWIAQHRAELDALPQAWMRGEAVRQALFRSALLAGRSQPDPKLGWGAVRAPALLATAPLPSGQLVAEARASASWAWLKLLTGQGVGFGATGLAASDRLLGLELAQLAQRDPAVAATLRDPDGEEVPQRERRAALEAAEASPLASAALKTAIANALGGKVRAASRPPPLTAPPPAGAPPVGVLTAPPARRRLTIFALDPSLGAALNSYEHQIATVDIPNEPDLQPGPVGEYVEVVDVDPGSDRIYGPVDLNDPNLMLQDGVTPSEGNPAFHQQMSYAVAMRTIEHFELALGRKALWASSWSGRTSTPNEFVRRLRIYPHALRDENAYYSPDKKALLFGYFPAHSQVSDLTPPGTMVFGCLSADIVAHETTHALLDGQARTFREASNPDVRAFHEAFADIVALFQQYTYRDLVKREIANARADLSAAGLLGGLARQFGEGTGRSGPLRRYPDTDPTLSYDTTFETHARGSLLVTAVYEAFLAIVERRTGDLIRLATGGSGVLPAGALHPDLVERLTDETCRAARHVLRICIRAVDYCPPADITFGEYLRALITADLEHVPVDRFGYRVAFLEAFRRQQLLPRSLRTVSIETLRWRGWTGPSPAWLAPAITKLGIDLTARMSRAEIFAIMEARRKSLRADILRGLNSQADCDVLGLQHRLPIYRSLNSKPYFSGTAFMVDNVRVAKRVRDDGELKVDLVAVVRQRRPESLDDSDGGDRFWFRGGATLIIDPFGASGPELRHVIRKPMLSPTRLTRERQFRVGDAEGSLRATYFGAAPGGNGFAEREPFAVIHSDRT